jgi:drug/metabolite transporter (DMT)-like permease
VTLAVALLGEAISMREVAGVVAIVLGGVALSRAIAGTSTPGGPLGLRAAGFPLIAGVSWACADVLSRAVLRDVGSPIAGATISIAAALALWLVVVGCVPGLRRAVRFGAVPTFACSGIAMGVATLFLFKALDTGKVSAVTPIIATQPLVVLVLSAIWLRHLERVHRLTVGAACLVAAGTTLLVT